MDEYQSSTTRGMLLYLHKRCELFCKKSGMAPTMLGKLIDNNPAMMKRIEEGKITMQSYDKWSTALTKLNSDFMDNLENAERHRDQSGAVPRADRGITRRSPE